jgi:1-acyl-sn-glycerol-3-phosphate acyltransferase
VAKPSLDPNHPARLLRFARGARLIRPVMWPFARVSYDPAAMPDIDRPLVMVANHRSLFDVFVAVEALDRYGHRARCLVRRRYMDRVGLGHGLRLFDCIPAGDGSGEAIGEAVETLEAGRSVAVMAEGRIPRPEQRALDGLGDIRAGFVAIARKVDAFILPIGITGTDAVWPRGGVPRPRPWARPRVDVRLGRPFEIGERGDDEVVATTRSAIAALLTDRR